MSTDRAGVDIVDTPTLNKGTAFSDEERKSLGLQGLLPPHVETLDEQVVRAYEAYDRQGDDLARHVYLRGLQDTNEVLFYRLLLDHIVEMLPIVYTPTVGAGVPASSARSTAARAGCSSPIRTGTTSAEVLRNRPERRGRRDRRDRRRAHSRARRPGHRRHGHPDRQALAVHADRRHPARRGRCRSCSTSAPTTPSGSTTRSTSAGATSASAATTTTTSSTQFVSAVQRGAARRLLQWEDFATAHARPILERYRDKLLTFNDDIQGTAAVALGAIIGGDQRDRAAAVATSGSSSSAPARPASAWPTTCVQRSSRTGCPRRRRGGRFWIVDKDGLLARRAARTSARSARVRPAGRRPWPTGRARPPARSSWPRSCGQVRRRRS